MHTPETCIYTTRSVCVLCACALQGTERKPVGGVFPFQLDQLERIFKVLGHPSTHIWPDLQYLPHWHDNTDNIRTTKPEYPRPPQPAGGAADHGAWTAWAAQQLESAVVEGMRSALPSWLHGESVCARVCVCVCVCVCVRALSRAMRGSEIGRYTRGNMKHRGQMCFCAYATGQIPAECRPSPEAFQLLARMLDPNPNTRISAEDALRHEYFTQCAPAPTPNVFYAPVRSAHVSHTDTHRHTHTHQRTHAHRHDDTHKQAPRGAYKMSGSRDEMCFFASPVYCRVPRSLPCGTRHVSWVLQGRVAQGTLVMRRNPLQ